MELEVQRSPEAGPPPKISPAQEKVFDSARFREFSNLAEAFFDRADRAPKEIAYSQSDLSGETLSPDGKKLRQWVPTLYEDSKERVEKLAEYLAAAGAEKGERVMILSNTRPEWAEAEVAIYRSGAAVATAYTSDPAERNGFVAHDSGASVAIVENREQLAKLIGCMTKPFVVPKTERHEEQEVTLDLKKIVVMEEFDANEVPADLRDRVISLKEIVSHQGSFAADGSSPDWESPEHKAGRDDAATIVYTSGTTGAPKGVVATHGEHLENISQIFEAGFYDGRKSILHVLPLAHAFGMRMQHLSYFSEGTSYFPGIVDRNSSRVSREMRESWTLDIGTAGMQLMPLVPKLLGPMRDGIMAKLEETPGLQGFFGRLAVNTYVRAFQAEQGEEPSANLSAGRRFKEKLLNLGAVALKPLLEATGIGPKTMHTIKEKLVGSNCEGFVAGGSKLPKDVMHFFWAIGLPVYEGYGSTETNTPISVNMPGQCRLGSVGKIFPGIEVKIAEDGEILVRGGNLAHRYDGRPEATGKTWDAEGWYHTRDAGYIDKDGYLYILGRIDDAEKGSHGEFVQAGRLEEALSKLPYLNEVVVHTEHRPCTIALASVKPEGVQKLLPGVDLGEKPWENPAVRSAVLEAIKRDFNPEVKSYERIQNVGLIPPLSIGNGLTPSFKVQRKWVKKQNEALIDQLYQELEE